MKRSCLLTLALLSVAAACAQQAPPHRQTGVRAVSLAPSITEIAFAAGAGSNLVGRTSACDFPQAARAVPVVGDFGVPSLEQLAATRPTVVLELALADESVGARIDRLGLKRRRIPCNRLAEIPPAIREIGDILGRPDQAGILATGIENGIAAMRAELPADSRRPAVFVEVWNDPITTAGRESFVADLVELAGGTNIGSESPAAYYTVSSEWVLAKNPDVILTLYMTPGTNTAPVSARAGWNTVAAVRNGRVYAGLNNDVVLRPGPRVMEGAALLRKCLHPVQNR